MAPAEDMVLTDQPMLEVLRSSAERIFVPLTVGGGIRSYVDAKGQSYSALDVADAYFRAGGGHLRRDLGVLGLGP